MGAPKRCVPCAMLAAIALGSLVAGGANAQMCRWVDENGTVHYAETCPEGVNSRTVELQAPPTGAQVEAAEQRAAVADQRLRTREPEKSRPGESLSLHELGPLPDNASSRYLTTLSTGVNTNTREMNAQFVLRLQANRDLPVGAYVEVHFPDPAGRGNQDVTGMALEKPRADMLFLSPGSKGFRCMNYEVEVLVFGDESKTALLGTHRQTIQSRLDMSAVRSRTDLVTGMTGGFCPDDLTGKSAAELEAMCEAARGQRLKPLRDQEIARCIEEQGRDRAYCEQYFSTFGDAEVRGYRVIPRMFDDLPECVAARQAQTGER